MSSQPSQPVGGRQRDFGGQPPELEHRPPGYPDVDADVSAGQSWSPVPLVLAVSVLVLGALLGVANQDASGTSMTLRVPALLAALLMVGQGAVEIKRNMPPKQRPVQHSRTVDQRGQAVAAAAAHRATIHEINRAQVQPAAVRPTPSNLAVPICVMILSAWLGLADLRVTDAPAALSVLSLVAAFALFALAWSLLPARR